ncbi:MAG: hypothetical protein AB8B73_10590 [Ekhidna sp.]
MKSVTTSRFRKLKEKLPKGIQLQADNAYNTWKTNSNHPSLQFKKIHERLPIYSVRITISYRAIGRLEGDVMIWFWIGNHNDYDKLISSIK